MIDLAILNDPMSLAVFVFIVGYFGVMVGIIINETCIKEN